MELEQQILNPEVLLTVACLLSVVGVLAGFRMAAIGLSRFKDIQTGLDRVNAAIERSPKRDS